MLPRIQPIAPVKIEAPFNDPDFVFELKHDGFRAVSYIEDGTCRLISRKQIQYKNFATLCTAMAKLPVKSAILDGELVCLDGDGRSQFRQVMRRKSQEVCFYAFDLLWLDGQDLRGLPLLERKSRLRQLVRGRTGFLYAEHVPINGRDCEHHTQATRMYLVCVHVMNGEPISLFEDAKERTPSKEGQDGWMVCSVCAELGEEPLMASTTLLCGNCADRLMAEQDFVR